MANPLTVNGQSVSPDESKILEDLMNRLPIAHNGDRNITDQEAVRFLDIAEDEVVDFCDVTLFNKKSGVDKELTETNFKRAYEILSKYSKPVQALKLGLFDRKCSKLLNALNHNRRRIYYNNISANLNGYSTAIDDSVIQKLIESVKELNPYLENPVKEFSMTWYPKLDLPSVNPQHNEFYSGILNYGSQAASAAVWYKLAQHVAKEWKGAGWETISQTYLKIETLEPVLKALDFGEVLPGIPKTWGLAHRMEMLRDPERGGSPKAKVRVEILDLFASVAVMVRFFPVELKKRIEGITDPTQREAARTFAQTVAKKFKLAF